MTDVLERVGLRDDDADFERIVAPLSVERRIRGDLASAAGDIVLPPQDDLIGAFPRARMETGVVEAAGQLSAMGRWNRGHVGPGDMQARRTTLFGHSVLRRAMPRIINGQYTV